jgi:hypothetical protein
MDQYKQPVEKLGLQAVQKGPRCEAREKSTSAGVFADTLERGDSSATKQVRLFQQPYLITPAFRDRFDALVLGLEFFSRSEFLESFLHQVLRAHFFDGRDIVTEPANLLLIR